MDLELPHTGLGIVSTVLVDAATAIVMSASVTSEVLNRKASNSVPRKRVIWKVRGVKFGRSVVLVTERFFAVF